MKRETIYVDSEEKCLRRIQACMAEYKKVSVENVQGMYRLTICETEYSLSDRYAEVQAERLQYMYRKFEEVTEKLPYTGYITGETPNDVYLRCIAGLESEIPSKSTFKKYLQSKGIQFARGRKCNSETKTSVVVGRIFKTEITEYR